MSLRLCLVAAPLLALLMLPTTASAGVLIEYTFTGGSADATIVEPAVTASAWAAVGLSSVSYASGYAYGQANNTAFVLPALPDDPDGNYYWEFTIDAGGDHLDLESLSFEHWYDGAGRGGAYTLRSSLDDYATSLFEVGDAGDHQHQTPTVDLTSLPAAESITFRFYAHKASSNLAHKGKWDNVQVVGLLTPEPATLALVALGGAGMAAARRRRRPR